MFLEIIWVGDMTHFPFLKSCHSHNIAVIDQEPYAEGVLSGLALKWVIWPHMESKLNNSSMQNLLVSAHYCGPFVFAYDLVYVCVCFISCVFARLTSACLRWKTESHCARLGRTTKVTIPGVYIKAKWWDTRIYASKDFLKIKMFVRWSTQPSCPQWQDCSNRCSTALRNNVFLYCCAVINHFHYFVYKLSKHTIKYQ